MIGGVKNVNTKSSKQTATLDAISVESFINETARVAGRYKDTSIDETVRKLIGEAAGIRAIKTDKSVFAEPTANKYSFVGNLRRPIDTIQWLCPKRVHLQITLDICFMKLMMDIILDPLTHC